MLVVVLITLALLLGLLFGGSSVWFLKPTQDRIVERTVNRYVCADGEVKSAQSECAVIVRGTGNTTIVCPPCNKTDFVYRKSDCDQCLKDCGHMIEGLVTSTTLHVPTCTSCTGNSECGQANFSDIKCGGGEMYKIYYEPFCNKDGCCVTTQTKKPIRECMDNERCEPVKGCVPYEEEGEE